MLLRAFLSKRRTELRAKMPALHAPATIEARGEKPVVGAVPHLDSIDFTVQADLEAEAGDAYTFTYATEAGREFVCGTQVELRALSSQSTPLVLPTQVKRIVALDRSRKFLHGLHFQGLTPDVDRTLTEFINRRQTERRARGL